MKTKFITMKNIFSSLIISCLAYCCYCQNLEYGHKIMFYNVENLFHPSDDSLTADEDFTPAGLYHWNYKKYNRKIAMIAKVIIAVGEGDFPWIVGLAEIENEQVLKDLCYNSPLKKGNYKYVHYESPDRRGVDVALLYRADSVNILRHRKIPIIFPFDSFAKNRDILHTAVSFNSGDSLEIFVNHWTSRFGGYAATVPKRNFYAQKVRDCVDSIIFKNNEAKILIMGDLNDYGTNESIFEILKARRIADNRKDIDLINLTLDLKGRNVFGTHKHEDFWGCLDQIIISKEFISSESGIRLFGEAKIFDAEFLLVNDEKYGGKKNYRTFLGPRYIGGFSDHLPIYISFRDD